MKVTSKSGARHYNIKPKSIDEGMLYVKTLQLDNEVGGDMLTEKERSGIWSRLKSLLKLNS